MAWFIRMAAVCLIAVLVTACGRDMTDSSLAGPDMSAFVTSAGAAASLVGPGGGTVAAGHGTLVIPPGALSQAETITLDATVVGEDNHCEFGPHGLQFAEPVELRIQLPPNATPGRHVIEWFNPSTGEWEDIGGRTLGGWVSTTIEHFSSYRLKANVLD